MAIGWCVNSLAENRKSSFRREVQFSTYYANVLQISEHSSVYLIEREEEHV